MDEIDMKLLKELWHDSRMSFNSLGHMLGISGNILKKRAIKLEEEGVFVFHTNPVFSQFGYARISFMAEISRTEREDFCKKVEQFEEVYEIIFSLSKSCAIIALLPFSSDEGISKATIEDFKRRFHEKIPDVPIIDVYKIQYSTGDAELKPMEMKLIRLLRQDSRKDLINLSEKLDLSKKTLSRYLQKFSKSNLIVHTIGLQPSKIRNFVIHLLIILFKDDKHFKEKVDKLREELPNYLSYYILIDPPGIAFYIYSNTLAEMEELVEKTSNLKEVKDIQVFFPSYIVRFEKWKDLVIPINE
ncbi:MAG: winged helix-turn-helix transcriptional regulator [Candidatus Lokiarchaeota archaeon]|nr:winged helix-turn-helix transcriptional regulator [Candidatus Lokiarchaeota archaeon]